MMEKESIQLANNCLKEIERLWVGVNQAMFLLAKDDLSDTKGYRRLKALLKDNLTTVAALAGDYNKGGEDDTTFHPDWLDAEPSSGPY